MSSAKQMDPLTDHAFGFDDGRHGGREPDHWHGRHFEHDGKFEGPDSGGHPPSPFGHGGDMGWGPAAWSDAGGFEHVLGGGLGGSLAGAPTDHLNAGNATPFQNDVTETTNIIFDAGPGGTIVVGGNVEALANQSAALIEGSSQGIGSFIHNTQVETTNIIFDVANGGTIDVGGNVVAASTQHGQIEPPPAMDGHFV